MTLYFYNINLTLYSDMVYYIYLCLKFTVSNMICLSSNPELSNITAPGGSFIYGTEYEDNMFASGALDEDVPCAVCRTSNTYTSIMIPGRKSCYTG
jgi:hypothetical protein